MKKNSDSNKVKNCLGNQWILGNLLSKKNPQTLATVETHTLPLSLWITTVPQHEI